MEREDSELGLFVVSAMRPTSKCLCYLRDAV